MTEGRRVSARLRGSVKQDEADEPTVNHTPKSSGKTRGKNKAKATGRGQVQEPAKEKSPDRVQTITLPSKLVEGQPLPALPELQPKDLSDAEWQSVGDSGVLAASLPRSRQRWLQEGLFDIYWSKSTYKKKKDQTDSNKAKEARPNMTKVGTCKMVVEPHIFDVTLFVIKDMSAPSPYSQNVRPFVSYNSSPNQGVPYHTPSYQSPKIQSPLVPNKPIYGPPTTASTGIRPIQPSTNTTPYSNPTTSYASSSSKPVVQPNKPSSAVPGAGSNTRTSLPNTPSQSVPQSKSATSMAPATPATNQYPTASGIGSGSSTKPQNHHAATTSAKMPKTSVTPVGTPTSMPGAAPASKSKPTLATSSTTRSTPTQPTNQQQQPAKTAPAQDPVIQMLAHRAQNDNALKQVMKLVATGQATPAQLSYFQGHIDELTKIAKDRQEEERKKKAALEKQQKQNPMPRQQYTPISAQNRGPVQHTTGPTQPSYGYNTPGSRLSTPSANSAPRPVYQPSPASIQPRAPRPMYIPPPLHVLLEFNQNSTSRFLFPKNSILEYDTKSNSVLASFLIVKTESQLLNSETESKKTKKSDAKGKSKVESTPDGTPAKPDSNPEVKKETSTAEGEKNTSAQTVEKEFYQPVTVRFESPSDPTILSLFGKVVAPVEQVQKDMLGVAEKAELVPTTYLAMRLPRESKEIVIPNTGTPETTAA